MLTHRVLNDDEATFTDLQDFRPEFVGPPDVVDYALPVTAEVA